MDPAQSVIIALLLHPPLLNSRVLQEPTPIALQFTMPRNASAALPATTAWLEAVLSWLRPALLERTPLTIHRNHQRPASPLQPDIFHLRQLKLLLLAGWDTIPVLGSPPVRFVPWDTTAVAIQHLIRA